MEPPLRALRTPVARPQGGEEEERIALVEVEAHEQAQKLSIGDAGIELAKFHLICSEFTSRQAFFAFHWRLPPRRFIVQPDWCPFFSR